MIRYLRKIKLTEHFIVKKEKVKHDYYVLLFQDKKNSSVLTVQGH